MRENELADRLDQRSFPGRLAFSPGIAVAFICFQRFHLNALDSRIMKGRTMRTQSLIHASSCCRSVWAPRQKNCGCSSSRRSGEELRSTCIQNGVRPPLSHDAT
jgi:hypothetical protein